MKHRRLDRLTRRQRRWVGGYIAFAALYAALGVWQLVAGGWAGFFSLACSAATLVLAWALRRVYRQRNRWYLAESAQVERLLAALDVHNPAHPNCPCHACKKKREEAP